MSNEYKIKVDFELKNEYYWWTKTDSAFILYESLKSPGIFTAIKGFSPESPSICHER